MKKIISIILALATISMLACGCSKGGSTGVTAVGNLELDINENGLFGFIDETGRVIIDYKYYYAEPFSDGLALVKGDKGYGYINKQGKMCITGNFDVACSFSDGLAKVSDKGEDNNNYYYIDTNGKIAFETKYYDAESFSNGMAMVANTRGEGEIGFINTKGELVVPCIYDYATDYSEGLAWVQKDDVRYYLDKNGEVSLDAGVYHGQPFSEGLSAVAKDGGHEGWGFIDKSGNEAIPCDYQYVESFSDGVALVEYEGDSYWDDDCGYIDQNGNFLFGGYEEAGSFYNGYAAVSTGDYDESKWGIIDKNNNMVVPFERDGISYVTHDEETGVVLYEIKSKKHDSYYYALINSKGFHNFDYLDDLDETEFY